VLYTNISHVNSFTSPDKIKLYGFIAICEQVHNVGVYMHLIVISKLNF